jgi:hypothetical protein
MGEKALRLSRGPAGQGDVTAAEVTPPHPTQVRASVLPGIAQGPHRQVRARADRLAPNVFTRRVGTPSAQHCFAALAAGGASRNLRTFRRPLRPRRGRRSGRALPQSECARKTCCMASHLAWRKWGGLGSGAGDLAGGEPSRGKPRPRTHLRSGDRASPHRRLRSSVWPGPSGRRATRPLASPTLVLPIRAAPRGTRSPT